MRRTPEGRLWNPGAGGVWAPTAASACCAVCDHHFPPETRGSAAACVSHRSLGPSPGWAQRGAPRPHTSTCQSPRGAGGLGAACPDWQPRPTTPTWPPRAQCPPVAGTKHEGPDSGEADWRQSSLCWLDSQASANRPSAAAGASDSAATSPGSNPGPASKWPRRAVPGLRIHQARTVPAATSSGGWTHCVRWSAFTSRTMRWAQWATSGSPASHPPVTREPSGGFQHVSPPCGSRRTEQGGRKEKHTDSEDSRLTPPPHRSAHAAWVQNATEAWAAGLQNGSPRPPSAPTSHSGMQGGGRGVLGDREGKHGSWKIKYWRLWLWCQKAWAAVSAPELPPAWRTPSFGLSPPRLPLFWNRHHYGLIRLLWW